VSNSNVPQFLSPEGAQSFWNANEARVGLMTIQVIWKMGLPGTSGGDEPSGVLGKTPGRAAVRRYMVEDYDLLADIRERAHRGFFRGVARGKVRVDKASGYLFRIVERATWRLATARAEQLLVTLAPTKEADTLDGVADPGWLPDETADRAENIRRLVAAVHALKPRDKELILRRLDDEPYEDIARDLGDSRDALKKRHHDLVARLARQLRADPVDAA
jgi:RNA polymerase sigma factor (sigma-70 family)